MNVDAELLFHVVAYGIAEFNHFVASGSSTVDEHESLFGMNTGVAKRAPFPSTLFNHPARRNLHTVGIHLIVRHRGIESRELKIFAAAHHGIHEEAAGIAFHCGVGQLFAANVDDGVAQLASGFSIPCVCSFARMLP